MQRVALAVEEEAFVRIDPKGADAERKGDAVQQLAVLRTQLDGQRVEIRTGLAIPEVRAANLERLLHLRGAVAVAVAVASATPTILFRLSLSRFLTLIGCSDAS